MWDEVKKMICETLKLVKGSKSEVIKELINDKIMKQKDKCLASTIKDAKLVKAREDYDKAKIVLKNKEKVWDQRIKQLGLEYYSWSNNPHYSVSGCFVSKKDILDLQNANNFWSLGMKKKSQTIWNKLIKKHDLDKEQ